LWQDARDFDGFDDHMNNGKPENLSIVQIRPNPLHLTTKGLADRNDDLEVIGLEILHFPQIRSRTLQLNWSPPDKMQGKVK
jgi:hypothetical protein